MSKDDCVFSTDTDRSSAFNLSEISKTTLAILHS